MRIECWDKLGRELVILIDLKEGFQGRMDGIGSELDLEGRERGVQEWVEVIE